MSLRAALGPALRTISPAHQRWQKLLRSLTLDPDALPRMDPLSPHDYLICGAPRSGTALLTAMLFQPPGSITVMEPWDALRLPPAQLFYSLRSEIAQGRLARGRLDIDALRVERSVRWVSESAAEYSVTASEGFKLGVKFPCFWRYLGRLPGTKFLVCVRDPAEVIASFASTDGRLAQGLDYDVPFNRTMNDQLLSATDDAGERRVLLYDYIYERVLPFVDDPLVYVVRYEQWFSDPKALLAEIGDFLGIELPRATVDVRHSTKRSPEPAAAVRGRSSTAAALGYR